MREREILPRALREERTIVEIKCFEDVFVFIFLFIDRIEISSEPRCLLRLNVRFDPLDVLADLRKCSNLALQ